MIYVQGPVKIWVADSPGQEVTPPPPNPPPPRFLGWSEDDIFISFTRSYEPIPGDYSGMNPADVMLVGKGLNIEFTLVDFVQEILEVVQKGFAPSTRGFQGHDAGVPPNATDGTRGSPAEIGALMYREHGTFRIIFHSGYAVTKKIFRDMKAVPAVNVNYARLDGPAQETWGMKRKRVRLKIVADAYVVPTTGDGFLWDTEVDDVPAEIPNIDIPPPEEPE